MLTQNNRKVIEGAIQTAYWKGLYIGSLMVNFILRIVYGFQEKVVHILLGILMIIGAIIMTLIYRYWVRKLT